ncbi:MAG TPA: hypothetical protein V6D08_14170 [Candidatus Obscuribacterales bacterium]
MSEKNMTLSQAARLFLARQAESAQPTPAGQSTAPPPRTSSPAGKVVRLPIPSPVKPSPVATGEGRRKYVPAESAPSTYRPHSGAHGQGEEQWARCCQTVHHTGLVHCGFRPLNLAVVDVTNPSDVGLAYLDLGPFFTRHLSRM